LFPRVGEVVLIFQRGQLSFSSGFQSPAGLVVWCVVNTPYAGFAAPGDAKKYWNRYPNILPRSVISKPSSLPSVAGSVPDHKLSPLMPGLLSNLGASHFEMRAHLWIWRLALELLRAPDSLLRTCAGL
jgi:hypothetical protein